MERIKNEQMGLIDNIQLFDELSILQKKALQISLKKQHYSKHDYLFRCKELITEVRFVNSGRVKIVNYSDSEKESIKYILNEGDCYGGIAIIDPENFTTHKDSAKVIDKDTVVLSLPIEELKKICNENANIYQKLVKNTLMKYRRLENRLESVMLKKSRERVVDFIKEMAEDVGKPIGYELLIKHNLTHQEIASLTGISRQKVTTILNEFKQEGLIHLERNSILVHDLSNLK